MSRITLASLYQNKELLIIIIKSSSSSSRSISVKVKSHRKKDPEIPRLKFFIETSHITHTGGILKKVRTIKDL